MHLGPIDLAKEIQSYIDNTVQADTPNIAAKFGITMELVTELLRLLDLCDMAQERVNIGILDRSVALVLAGLGTADQLSLLERATTSTAAEFRFYMESDHVKVKGNIAARERAMAMADRFVLLLKTNSLGEVCKKEGCTPLCVLNRLALFDLINDADRAFRDGRLCLQNACDLGRMPYKLQPYYLKEAIEMDSQQFLSLLYSDGVMQS